MIAIHGATAEDHDGIVGKKGAFARTLQGIRNIKDHLSSRIACNSVILSLNVRDIPRIAELCFSLGVEQYSATLVQSCGSAKENENTIFPEVGDIERCIDATASVAGDGHLSFNNVPFCLMGDHCNLSVNFPPAYPVGEAFELVCYPADPTRDYAVLKMLFPKRPTCATCPPGACSRFASHLIEVSCSSAQRRVMEAYCRMCEGCFFQKVCPGLPLAIAATSDLTGIRRIGSREGLSMMANIAMHTDGNSTALHSRR